MITLSPVEQQLVALASQLRQEGISAITQEFSRLVAPVVTAHAAEISDPHSQIDFRVVDGAFVMLIAEPGQAANTTT